MRRAVHEHRGRLVRLTRHAIIVGAGALVMSLPVIAVVPDTAATTIQSTGTTNATCAPSIVNGPIPSWASAGFTPRNYHMHYELGSADKIVALLWKFPLLSPPAKNVANKILWVSHLPTNGSPLMISAQRTASGQAVGPIVHRRVIGGPGPSYVNLPTSGCWHLDLHWSGHTDSLDLQYVAAPT